MTRGHRGGSRASERGSVTAELAVGMVAVVTVLLVVLAVGAVTVTRLRCADGARAGVRAAALGRPDAEVRGTVARVVGPSASVGVVRSGDGWVQVTVRAAVGALGPAHGLTASAVAVGRVEP